MPTCLRFQYGKKESDYENALHGTESETDAIRELHFFFPEGERKFLLIF
jgi:nucleoside diphosphate kinase